MQWFENVRDDKERVSYRAFTTEACVILLLADILVIFLMFVGTAYMRHYIEWCPQLPAALVNVCLGR